MHKIGNPEKRIQRMMKRLRVEPKDVARAANISVRTLENVIKGSSTSHIARQKITDFLVAKIWPGVRPATIPVALPSGFVFSDLTLEQINLCRREVPTARVIGRTVTLTQPIRALLRFWNAPAVEKIRPSTVADEEEGKSEEHYDWRTYECKSGHERKILRAFATLEARLLNMQGEIDHLKELPCKLASIEVQDAPKGDTK